MVITKLGHSCLVIEIGEVRILTDPGAWTTAQNKVRNIDAVLITHEHDDHFHLDSLRTCIANNPQAVIITNDGVGKYLKDAGMVYQAVNDGDVRTVHDVVIEAVGHRHASIYPGVPEVVNTGFFIAHELYYPGDALHVPKKLVSILALPVAAPWVKISEVLNYALAVKPKICFPMHDGMLKITGAFYALPSRVLSEHGVRFCPLKENESLDSGKYASN
jgi:L-ascorbate metabolism protein UlaG (beta-lactamase superfamily)